MALLQRRAMPDPDLIDANTPASMKRLFAAAEIIHRLYPEQAYADLRARKVSELDAASKIVQLISARRLSSGTAVVEWNEASRG